MRTLVILSLLLTHSCFAGIWVTPEYAGDSETDSVIISFCVFDTTLYPVLTDADSLTALRLGPDNTLVDSLDEGSAQLHHPRTGWYELHYRAADASANVGTYRVFVRAFVGGDWRGAAAVSYQVIGDGVGGYFAQLATGQGEIQDSVSEVLQHLPQLGGGAYPCTLFVFDSVNSTAIAGASATLFNSDESAVVASSRTDDIGRLLLSLDAGTYHAYSHALNYNPAGSAASISVTSAGANDTLWLTPFDPGAPVLANLCRVYGFIHDLNGQPIPEVTIQAAIDVNSIASGGAVISPFASSATTDTLGFWYLDLIPSTSLEPDTTTYDFSIYYPSGTILRRTVAIPDSDSYWLK